MKKKLVVAISFVGVFAVGCLLGAFVQHLRAGYRQKVLKTESFSFPDGEVTLSYTIESIGMPFLDPETSVLTVTTKYGLPITVYKAKRMFQESCPHIQGVKTDGNRIVWQDGINHYSLAIAPIEQNVEQGATPLPPAPQTWPSEGVR